MIGGRLRPGEALVLQPPTALVNTAAPTESYVALAPENRSRIRQEVFDRLEHGGAAPGTGP
jgi:hypothetical protein